jgi:hypothetical protein
MNQSPAAGTPSWHALLAELPPDVAPQRRAVAPPELLDRPEGKAIAGWDQLVIELPAGDAGLRMILVVLDAEDTVISASDAVLQRVERDAQGVERADRKAPKRTGAVEYRHESLGGRFEHDGRFHGARWRVVTADEGDEDAPPLDSSSCEPSEDDLSALHALVREMVRRAPPRAT